jgi:hypothetical protein
MAERKRLRHQFADDNGHEHQRNGDDRDRQRCCRSFAKAEPLLEKWVHKFLSTRTANGARKQAHESNAHLDGGQRPLGPLTQTQEVPDPDVASDGVRPDVSFRCRHESDLECRQRGIEGDTSKYNEHGCPVPTVGSGTLTFPAEFRTRCGFLRIRCLASVSSSHRRAMPLPWVEAPRLELPLPLHIRLRHPRPGPCQQPRFSTSTALSRCRR